MFVLVGLAVFASVCFLIASKFGNELSRLGYMGYITTLAIVFVALAAATATWQFVLFGLVTVVSGVTFAFSKKDNDSPDPLRRGSFYPGNPRVHRFTH